MNKLTDKIAVVTGASKGIGAAVARQLAAEGATVVVHYASARAQAERVVADIVSAGGRAVALGADVGVEAEVRALFRQVQERFGRVDVLVNNAGVYRFAPLADIAPADFHAMFDVNVLGTLLATREAVPLMPAGGAIVNLGSVASGLAPPAAAVYAASKGAIEVVTRSLAKELGPRGIRVNAVAPGLTITEGVRAAGIAGSDFERQMVALTPLGRVAQPMDIALPAVFLAGDGARLVTGETLFVGGGAGR